VQKRSAPKWATPKRAERNGECKKCAPSLLKIEISYFSNKVTKYLQNFWRRPVCLLFTKLPEKKTKIFLISLPIEAKV